VRRRERHLRRRKREVKKKKMEDRTILAMCAISTIGVIESLALSYGINGIMLTLTVAAIAGLGGYEIQNLGGAFKGRNPPSSPSPFDVLEFSAKKT